VSTIISYTSIRKKLYCEQCDMLIHEGELKWTKIYGQELALCPVHDELLKDSKKNY